jgi:D-alanyl-D-alanine carboxypeptidase
MKTGFTCASGYNLVATATRNRRRLIAVVLGAKSSTSRAIKAAQLFERGFGMRPLDSQLASLGAVDSLEPVAATPPDLHDDVCGNKRRRRSTNDVEAGGEAGTAPGRATNSLGERQVMTRSGAGLLTSGLAAAIPPVEVYTGPVRNDISANASVAPASMKKLLAVEARPAAGKPLSPVHRRLRERRR